MTDFEAPECPQCGSKFKHSENCMNNFSSDDDRINHVISDERVKKWVQALQFIDRKEESLQTTMIPELRSDLEEVRNR